MKFALAPLLLGQITNAATFVGGREIGYGSSCPNKIRPERIVQLNLPEGRPITKYMRTDGKTLIVTMAKGDVAMFTIGEDGKSKVIPNSFKDEAFLEPCGKYVISPNHEDGMRYYRVADVIKQGAKATPAMVHPMNDFYQSASSECKADGGVDMTVMTHEMMASADFSADSNGKINEKSAGVYCPNFYDEETQATLKKIVPDLALYHKVKMAMFGETRGEQDLKDNIIYDTRTWAKEPKNAKRFGLTQEQLMTIEQSYKHLQQKELRITVAEPILAPGGNVIAGTTLTGIVDMSLKVFKRDKAGNCQIYFDFHEQGGKPIFSHEMTADEVPKYAAYDRDTHARGTVMPLWNLETKKETVLKFDRDIHGQTSYPAFSQKGEMIVLNKKGQLMYFNPAKFQDLEGCAEIETGNKDTATPTPATAK